MPSDWPRGNYRKAGELPYSRWARGIASLSIFSQRNLGWFFGWGLILCTQKGAINFTLNRIWERTGSPVRSTNCATELSLKNKWSIWNHIKNRHYIEIREYSLAEHCLSFTLDING